MPISTGIGVLTQGWVWALNSDLILASRILQDWRQLSLWGECSAGRLQEAAAGTVLGQAFGQQWPGDAKGTRRRSAE